MGATLENNITESAENNSVMQQGYESHMIHEQIHLMYNMLLHFRV